MDTGAAELYLPKYVLDLVHNFQIVRLKHPYSFNEHSGWLEFDCADQNNLVTIDLKFGGIWLEHSV